MPAPCEREMEDAEAEIFGSADTPLVISALGWAVLPPLAALKAEAENLVAGRRWRSGTRPSARSGKSSRICRRSGNA